VLHERGELLDGLLGGGRHCRRQRGPTGGGKSGLLCLPFSSSVPPLSTSSVLVFLRVPTHTVTAQHTPHRVYVSGGGGVGAAAPLR
jgi:hypothetical protein